MLHDTYLCHVVKIAFYLPDISPTHILMGTFETTYFTYNPAWDAKAEARYSFVR